MCVIFFFFKRESQNYEMRKKNVPRSIVARSWKLNRAVTAKFVIKMPPLCFLLIGYFTARLIARNWTSMSQISLYAVLFAPLITPVTLERPETGLSLNPSVRSANKRVRSILPFKLYIYMPTCNLLREVKLLTCTIDISKARKMSFL